MFDRLAELRSGTYAIPITPETAEEEVIPDFNRKAQQIQYYINKIKESNKRVKQLKEKHSMATLSDQEREISNELDSLISENNKNCLAVKQDIEALEADVNKAKRMEPDEPETRIKDINCRAIKDRFFTVLQEAQDTQINFKTAVKKKITRQVRIMDPTLSEEQVENVCADPDGASRLLTEKMLGKGHLKIRNAVADIEDKYKDIIKLEKSVELVHQMFIDMQMLVQAQGEMLDNIELHVGEAKDYMKKANVQLAKAKKSHKSYKKWRCWLLMCLMIVLALVIIVPVVVTKMNG